MDRRFRIAVIIPVYNREKYVRETLESVDAQTRLPDQIVVVDDGSSDRSVEVIKQWRPRRAPEVTLIEQANQGAATAMNVAVQNADAELIAPLDSDDAFLPGHLEKLESAFQRHPDLALVAGNSGRLDDLPHGKRQGFDESVFETMPYDEESDGLRLVRGSAYQSLLRGAFIPTCSTLFSKQKAEESGLYDPSLATYYDMDMWMRMSRLGPFAFFMEPVSLVRKHDQNLTHRSNIATHILCGLTVRSKMIEAAERMQLSPDELEATRKELQRYLERAPNRASRYGLVPYGKVCRAIWKMGHARPLLSVKPLARALLRPRGDRSRLRPTAATS